MDWKIVIAVIGIVVGAGGITGLVLIPSQKRKFQSEGHLTEADAATRLSDAALKLLEPARQEIDRLNNRLTRAEERVEQLTNSLTAAQAEVSELRTQVSRATKDHAAAIEEIHRLQGGTQ